MALTTDLVSYYKFDGDADDSVGSNDGSVSGAVNGSAYGKINQGYLFDGTNDYIQTSLKLNESAFTVSLWAYKTDDSTMGFFSGLNGVGTRNGVRIVNWGSNGVSLTTYDGGVQESTGYYSISNTAWHHLVATFDGVNGKLYIDGVLKETKAMTPDTLTNNIQFGGYYIDDTSSNMMKGYIDEPGVWSRALTSTEVLTLYNTGTGSQYPFSSGYVVEDVFQGTIDDYWNLYDWSTRGGAQLFTASSSYTLSKIELNIATVGTPPADLQVFLYSVSSGVPNTLLATFSNIEASGLSSSYTWAESTGSYAVTSGTQYAIVTSMAGGSSSDCYKLGRVTGGGYSGGTEAYMSSSSWTAYSGDVPFRTYSFTGSTGYSNKIMGVTATKIMGIPVADVVKFIGV